MFEMFSRQDLEIELLNTVPAKYFRMGFDLQEPQAGSGHMCARPCELLACAVLTGFGGHLSHEGFAGSEFFIPAESVYWDNFLRNESFF